MLLNTRSLTTNLWQKIKTLIKLQIVGGAASPAPPVGTALGAGLNIAEFCRNSTMRHPSSRRSLPVIITVYEDRTYDFILKIAPVAEMLKKAAGIQKGSGKPLQEKIGKVTKAQIREIAEKKLPDLNCHTVEAAMRQVEGTAKTWV
jgi:large subunit ribosomal protein L11